MAKISVSRARSCSIATRSVTSRTLTATPAMSGWSRKLVATMSTVIQLPSARTTRSGAGLGTPTPKPPAAVAVAHPEHARVRLVGPAPGQGGERSADRLVVLGDDEGLPALALETGGGPGEEAVEGRAGVAHVPEQVAHDHRVRAVLD